MRFIAIYDQVDSETNPDDDITPFKNILNEMYAKDCSKKIKAVFKAKGNSGKHLGTFPPFGYVKSAEDKNQWIIDYEAAEIVKEAFKLCIQGYGPTQIARNSRKRVTIRLLSIIGNTACRQLTRYVSDRKSGRLNLLWVCCRG